MIVAVFGGSFNPPHVAHVFAVAYVLATQQIDRLVVLPTYQHPFAKTLAPFDDRVKMCEEAMGWMPRVEVSRVEADLGGESRTLRTLEHLHDAHPDWAMRLVMGADLLVESPKWFGFDTIRKLAPPLVLGRARITFDGAPAPVLPDISSTFVRERLAAKDWDALAEIVPRAVLLHIRKNGLYAAV